MMKALENKDGYNCRSNSVSVFALLVAVALASIVMVGPTAITSIAEAYPMDPTNSTETNQTGADGQISSKAKHDTVKNSVSNMK
jgi:hypothetical protein